MTIVTRHITHMCGVSFDVVDTDASAKWNFWGEFAAGRWEPDTLTVMAELLGPDDTFVDIGAWIGPLTLWAGQLCQQVIAVEPDPSARTALRANVGLNDGLAHTIVHKAAVVGNAEPSGTGYRQLVRHTEWGDSMTRLAPPDTPRCTESDSHLFVSTATFGNIVAGTGPIGLVKIDVEGAEGEIIAHAADEIRDLGCPVILAVHYPWMTAADAAAVTSFLHRYTVARLNGSPDDFPTYLLTP